MAEFCNTIPDIAAALLGWLLLAWISYLIYESQGAPKSPSPWLAYLRLFVHMWPALLSFVAIRASEYSMDPTLIWFITLLTLRYNKTALGMIFWFRYRITLPSPAFKLTGANCTVIVATVGPDENTAFAEAVSSILINRPTRLVFSTNTEKAKLAVERKLPSILNALQVGNSAYQIEHKLGGITTTTDIVVTNTGVSNKRQQTVNGFNNVDTEIIIMADDTAIWTPTFISATLPAFEDEKVALVGTKKWVKHVPRVSDPTKSWIANMWNNYWTGFWNAMGGLYLIRHNFEIRSSNAADGGVFCVSGRTSLIRASIVRDVEFEREFLAEYITIPFINLTYGPLAADDDNFITRWVLNRGWDIKIQYSDEAMITTVLGKWPKFTQQCQRWSRTTFRQNTVALFIDRTIWWKWPVTVWTTYFPWMWNAALIWDPLMVFVLTRTNLYQTSSHPGTLMGNFVGFIYATKLVKTAPWFWKHPSDFFLYFFPIPAYLVFVYYHSVLKVYTFCTLGDTEWSGRKLSGPEIPPTQVPGTVKPEIGGDEV
ncbi:hypothetical protein CC80DRAFT_506135 [Byssothecium circinans]|uniref:Glycosyltransferase family 2 protein n=1 Tax=Byssothecium circinans TaxID=147558 RepID=A0A6A5TQH3_9PLEO|nr:hypothetical protein CC80DRAFT_506135 [Byssothecium circinans]